MRYLRAASHNVRFYFDAESKSFLPEIELIFVVMENVYQEVNENEMVKKSKMSTHRFVVGGSKELRALAAQLTEYADELDGAYVTSSVKK